MASTHATQVDAHRNKCSVGGLQESAPNGTAFPPKAPNPLQWLRSPASFYFGTMWGKRRGQG